MGFMLRLPVHGSMKENKAGEQTLLGVMLRSR